MIKPKTQIKEYYISTYHSTLVKVKIYYYFIKREVIFLSECIIIRNLILYFLKVKHEIKLINNFDSHMNSSFNIREF